MRWLLLLALATVALLGAGACMGEDDSDSAKPKKTSSPVVVGSGVEDRRRFYLSSQDITLMRNHVNTYRWTRVAWLKTKQVADRALSATPGPPSPLANYVEKGDTSCPSATVGWYCGVYVPGLQDGQYAHSLALAYAVTGKREYATKAKVFLLAWAKTYAPPPPDGMVGHMVAEPVGFMLKAFMAYDIVQDVFTDGEKTTFREWARFFVARGKGQADSARDYPWVPEAPYGNSATWARSLAVFAAAVVGGETLSSTLRWNWSHTTPGGRGYGWENLLEGSMNKRGKMVEERVRQSIDYALYTWHPLALIAEVARQSGFSKNLWTFTTRNGKSLLRPVAYYEPYLVKRKAVPYSTEIHDVSSFLAEYRAAMEVAHKRFPNSPSLRRIVTFGGPVARGRNWDYHITSFNALLGAPVPEQAG